MKRHKRKLKIRGLHTPRIFIFLLGVLHGKVMKTAIVDGQTGYITSSYITTKCKLLSEMDAKALFWLEEDLKSRRTEVADLMVEEALLRQKLNTVPPADAVSASISAQRERSRSNRERLQNQERHKEILHRLVEVDEDIRYHERMMHEQVAAIAQALQSRFSSYSHGVLLAPVSADHLPPLDCQQAFAYYQQAHAREDTQRAALLKEVYQDETA